MRHRMIGETTMKTIRQAAVAAAAVFLLVSAYVLAQGETAKEEPTAPGSLSLEQVVVRLQANYESINTYQADFEQEVRRLSGAEPITRARGHVLYKKPGKMVWNYLEPEEHVYINEGNTIWDYSKAEKEAYWLPVKDSIYKSFLLGLGDLERDFEISFHAGRKLSHRGEYQLSLVPRNEEERQVLGTLTFYVDPESFLVVRTESVDSLGNRNLITFKNFKLNIELEDSLFKFTPPPGVRVIEADKALREGGR